MQKPPITLALVGKNLSSCVAALHLHDHLGAKLSWFQTLRDPDSSGDTQRLLINHIQRNQLKVSIEGEVLTENPQFFIGSHRHYPMNILIRYVKTRQCDCPYLQAEHPAVLAKALAAGLWNDLSPNVLDGAGSPRAHWIDELPDSAKDWESGPFSLVRRDQLIQATVNKISEQKSRSDFDRRRVLGIDRSSFNDGIQVIFNAPFGGENFQAVLWTSALYTIKDEGTKKSKMDVSAVAQRIGFWKTFTAEVPSHAIAFLPTLSVWLSDEEPSLRFRKTGLLASSSLRRVVVLPSSEPGKHSLQIQSLHFYDSPRSYNRPDSFMWSFCPYLKALPLNFAEQRAEENMVFRTPFSAYQRMGARLDFWMGGLDCAFRKVPKFQWGIDSRRRPREEAQPPSAQV